MLSTVLFSLATLSATIVGALYWCQSALLYFPQVPEGSRTVVARPSAFGLPDKDVWIVTADGVRIHGFYMRLVDPAAARSAPTVVFFHGNAGNIGHRLHNCLRTFELGVNILSVDYRGYGLSEGAPNEHGLRLDAQATLDFLFAQADVDTSKIVLFGRSLGGAVSVALAAANQDKIAAVVLENTFTSILDMIDEAMPLFTPFKFLCTNPWLTRDTIGALRTPILFLSGLADELVPSSQMAELHRLATAASWKRLSLYENGTHNETWMEPGYFEDLAHFFHTEFPALLAAKAARM